MSNHSKPDTKPDIARVNIHQAKTTLSKLVANVEETGATIALCRAGKPVASITPIEKPRTGGITPNLLLGQTWIADTFDTTTPAGAALFGIGAPK